jgi:hypothetical protein
MGSLDDFAKGYANHQKGQALVGLAILGLIGLIILGSILSYAISVAVSIVSEFVIYTSTNYQSIVLGALATLMIIFLIKRS